MKFILISVVAYTIGILASYLAISLHNEINIVEKFLDTEESVAQKTRYVVLGSLSTFNQNDNYLILEVGNRYTKDSTTQIRIDTKNIASVSEELYYLQDGARYWREYTPFVKQLGNLPIGSELSVGFDTDDQGRYSAKKVTVLKDVVS